MKKLVLFVLMVSMMFATCAHADAPTTDQVIRFRGLEWGCSINEAIENLREAGVNDRVTVSEQLYVSYIDYFTQVDGGGLDYCPGSRSFNNDIFVGGHMIDEIAVHATYGIVDGEVSRDPDDSRMYRAMYFFKMQDDVFALYDDLVAKLTTLYGEPRENPYAEPGETTCIWYGAEDTAVVIGIIDPEFYPCVYIDYWDLTVESTIHELQQLLYVDDPKSMDGLS